MNFLTDHIIGVLGLALTIPGTIFGILAFFKPDLAQALWRRCKVTFPYFPVFMLFSLLGVVVVGATAVMHWEDDSSSMPFRMISYACLLCAIVLGYLMLATIYFGRINILAWQGWELLDRHVGALSGWPGTRFRTLYYFRGIDSTTELYDKNRDPFNIMILDVEQIAAIDDQTEDSIASFPDPESVTYPVLLQRVLDENVDRFPQDKLRYGVPVRFGFNEILYTEGLDKHFLARDVRSSMSMLVLSELLEWAESKGKRLRLLLWDWSLPTLSLLLCAYKALEADRATPPHTYALGDVYKLEADSIRTVSATIVRDLGLFNVRDPRTGDFKHRAYRVGRIEELETLLGKRESNVHDVIIGFGSMATCTHDKELFSLIPREGVLTWVEFAAVIKGKGQDQAKRAISNVILSLATQIKLMNMKAPRGLPVNKDAYLHCAQQRPAPRMMTTARELEKSPNIPLVMRRLPGTAKTKVTPHDAAIREVWEEAWAAIRKELRNPLDDAR